MKYEPTLDGLRAIAILAVIAFHVQNEFGAMSGGFLGVDIFFVLSGFLITKILEEERKSTGSINIRVFYSRRAARLMPALILFVSCYMIFGPLLAPRYGTESHLRDAILTLLYVSDYSKAFWDIPDFLRHTWSLSVEQHFYILWPLAVLMLGKTKNPQKLLGMMLLLAFAWKSLSLLICTFDEVYYRFDTRLTGLMLGGLLAFQTDQTRMNTILTARSSNYAIAILILMLAVAQYESKVSLVVAGTITEIAAAILVGTLVKHRAGFVDQVFSHFSLVNVGKLSYGMYLWHFPIALIVRDRFSFLSAFAIVTAMSLFFAFISYVTVEAIFRNRRLPLARFN